MGGGSLQNRDGQQQSSETGARAGGLEGCGQQGPRTAWADKGPAGRKTGP